MMAAKPREVLLFEGKGLKPEEKVEAWADCSLGGFLGARPGIVAVTGRRVVFLRRGSGEVAEEIPHYAITELATRMTLLGSALRIACAKTVLDLKTADIAAVTLVYDRIQDCRKACAAAQAEAPPPGDLAQAALDMVYFEDHHKKPGEVIDYWAEGALDQALADRADGILVITDRRVVFYSRGRIEEAMREVPLADITGAEHGGKAVEIACAGADLRFKAFYEGAAQEICARLDSRRAHLAERQAAAPRALPPVGDLVEMLERLGRLRDQGVLNDEEFKAQKARLLGQ